MREPLPVREPRYLVEISADEVRTALFTDGRVRNISRGGLFVETPKPLPLAAAIHLALHLPEMSTVLKVKGRVVWTYDIRKSRSQLVAGSGVRFVEMTGDQFELLETYLARLVTTQARPSYLDATA